MDNQDYQNPFDSDEHQFFVLVNKHKQFSLWPQFANVPNGWQQRFGPESRAECLTYVEENWHDEVLFPTHKTA